MFRGCVSACLERWFVVFQACLQRGGQGLVVELIKGLVCVRPASGDAATAWLLMVDEDWVGGPSVAVDV